MEFNTNVIKFTEKDIIDEYNKYYENVDVIINDKGNDCEDKTKVPISSIKSVLYSLKRKGFISNYKDKHNNNIKGCYVIK